MHKVEDSDSKIVLLEDSVKRFNLFSFKYCEIQSNFPLSIILLFFVHRLEESTADKDSLLAIERHENCETKKELTGSQKKIEELLTEVQDARVNIAELEESVRRSVSSPYRDASSFYSDFSALTLFLLQLDNTTMCSNSYA
jgi:myosin V